MDCGTAAAGASIMMATSNDPDHPASCIIDGARDTFWLSTGMFPQEIVVALPAKVGVTRVGLTCKNVGRVTVQRSEEPTPKTFSDMASVACEAKRGDLQTEAITLHGEQARYLKFVIHDGHDDFVAVHSISVQGSP
jgi:heat shock protein beta-11